MTEILEPEATIARTACEEMQPMPLNGADAETVADCCEIIGESHAQKKEWRKCANAHRMACWYWKIAAHNPPNEKSSATGDQKPSPATAELQAPTPVGCGDLLDHDLETQKRQRRMVQDALPVSMHISADERKAYINGEKVKLKNGLTIWKGYQNSSEGHPYPDHHQPETKS